MLTAYHRGVAGAVNGQKGGITGVQAEDSMNLLLGGAERDQPPRLVGGSARIVNGSEPATVLLTSEQARERLIGPDVALLSDLARVRSANDVLAFVGRYGMLRHGPEHASEPIREPLEAWLHEAQQLQANLNLARLLMRGVKRGDHEAVDDLRLRLEALLQPEHRGKPDHDLLAIASSVLAHVVNDRLRAEGVGQAIDADVDIRAGGEPGVFYLAARSAGGALPFAYWQFARLLVGRAPLRLCEECGRVFMPTHGRQRFHDRQCAERARWRRRTKEGKV
jgi:hypothetical protein